MVGNRNRDRRPLCPWLPRRRISRKPCSARILQASRPDKIRSLPNRDLQTRHVDFGPETPLDLGGIGGLEEELQSLLEIPPRLLDGRSLARHVQLRAQG